MAIFSFRPAASATRRRGLDVPSDWAETRPSEFAESELAGAAFGSPSFEADPDASSPGGFDTAPAHGGRLSPVVAESADATAAAQRPDPGFAKNLTARAQSDELLGAGWYISSWDLMQGLDVIEGTPIDLLPPEWQRKRPRV
jgi:hypothetical protein